MIIFTCLLWRTKYDDQILASSYVPMYDTSTSLHTFDSSPKNIHIPITTYQLPVPVPAAIHTTYMYMHIVIVVVVVVEVARATK